MKCRRKGTGGRGRVTRPKGRVMGGAGIGMGGWGSLCCGHHEAGNVRAPVPPSSTPLHSPCRPVCSMASRKLGRSPPSLVESAAKIREASKVQECKTSHFMVRQRGQSDTGKVTTGQQSMKFGSFSDKGSTSQMCCCSCTRAWAPPGSNETGH